MAKRHIARRVFLEKKCDGSLFYLTRLRRSRICQLVCWNLPKGHLRSLVCQAAWNSRPRRLQGLGSCFSPHPRRHWKNHKWKKVNSILTCSQNVKTCCIICTQRPGWIKEQLYTATLQCVTMTFLWSKRKGLKDQVGMEGFWAKVNFFKLNPEFC